MAEWLTRYGCAARKSVRADGKRRRLGARLHDLVTRCHSAHRESIASDGPLRKYPGAIGRNAPLCSGARGPELALASLEIIGQSHYTGIRADDDVVVGRESLSADALPL